MPAVAGIEKSGGESLPRRFSRPGKCRGVQSSGLLISVPPRVGCCRFVYRDSGYTVTGCRLATLSRKIISTPVCPASPSGSGVTAGHPGQIQLSKPARGSRSPAVGRWQRSRERFVVRSRNPRRHIAGTTAGASLVRQIIYNRPKTTITDSRIRDRHKAGEVIGTSRRSSARQAAFPGQAVQVNAAGRPVAANRKTRGPGGALP